MTHKHRYCNATTTRHDSHGGCSPSDIDMKLRKPGPHDPLDWTSHRDMGTEFPQDSMYHPPTHTRKSIISVTAERLVRSHLAVRRGGISANDDVRRVE